MTCPVCGGSETEVINVRIAQESDLRQAIGSTWDGRNMARCNECGVLYDHQYVEAETRAEQPESSRQAPSTINCPECGSPNSGDRSSCSYCDAPLDGTSE